MRSKSQTRPVAPTRCCDECGLMKPSHSFVNDSCSECYNAGYMQHAGLPRLEQVDFDPIVRHDALGEEHTFYFSVMMTTGLGMYAFEWLDRHPGGYKFMVLEHPETPVQEAYEKLVRKIEAGVAVRYLRSSDFKDPSQNRLYIHGNALNGRIDEDDDGPVAVVDGQEMSWEELGRCISSHLGFNFRLEIFDQSHEPATTSHPEQPNTVWWLERPQHLTDDESTH